MKTPEKPHNDAQRLRSLHASGLLDSGSSERFDRLTRLAKRLFDIPVALVSLVDDDRLWLKACDTLPQREFARDDSFCGHAILHNDAFVVPDMLEDERFYDNPLVLGAPYVRFYAGYPVRLPDGATAGTFCLLIDKPRAFTADEIETLKDMAAIVEDEFSVINAATTDDLTGLLNRRGLKEMAGYVYASAQRRAQSLSLAYIDLDKFKLINDNHGHSQGDEALMAMADLMKAAFRGADLLARQGGDEFAVLFADTDEEGAVIAMEFLAEKVRQFNADPGRPWQLHFSWGVTEFDELKHDSLTALFADADARMYAMKKHHRQR